MRLSTRSDTLEADAEELARRWAVRPGAILLYDADRPGRRHLYFSPRWTLRWRAGNDFMWSGDAPADAPAEPSPLRWPWEFTRTWDGAASPCGIVGYLGYDTSTHPSRRHPTPPGFEIPDCWMGLYDAVLSFGAGPTELHVAELSDSHSGRSLRVEELWERRAAELLAARPVTVTSVSAVAETEPLDARWHRRAVERIQRELRAGDAYQVNLTGHVRARGGRDPYDHFLAEQAQNPTTHAAYLNLGEAIVASHSPERLLRLGNGQLRTSPIKGTAADTDGALTESAKDRAEHVMIVDLCRNDLGRVSHFGSVRVSSLMHGLRLRGLEHLQSHVDSQLDPRSRALLFDALFPGGSITGAPKIRAMEIIREVESHRRGVYTGTIGVIRCDGSAEWSIAIRTAVWQNGVCSFGCGGGIVLDSDPDAEYAEAHLKARSFLESLNPAPIVSEIVGA